MTCLRKVAVVLYLTCVTIALTEKVVKRQKRDTVGLAIAMNNVGRGTSVNSAIQEFEKISENEKAASTLLLIDNMSNFTLTFLKYYEPQTNRFRDSLPPSVFPGQQEGFTISTLGGYALEAGAVWGIEERPNLRVIAFWGAFRDDHNYLVVSVGSEELEKKIDDAVQNNKDDLKSSCSGMNDLLATESIESTKHCSDSDSFCLIGSMGGAQQTIVRLHFVSTLQDYLSGGVRRIFRNQKYLTDSLVVPAPKKSRCSAATSIYLSASILLAVQLFYLM